MNLQINDNGNHETAGYISKIGLEKMDEKEQTPLSPSDQHPCKSERKYQPGRGFRRYGNTLKNLIPIRCEANKPGIVGVDSAGLYSTIGFSWISKLLYSARRKEITLEEIPEISPYDACDYNVDRLEILWENELVRRGPEKASLSRVVWQFSRTRVLAASVCFAVSTVIGSISSSFLMRKLLEYVQSGEQTHDEGIKWALFMIISEFLRMITFSFTWAISHRTALRVRSACFMLLYKKIVRLSNSGDKSIGQVINMFTNDNQRVFEMIVYLPMLVGGPLLTMYAMFYAIWLFGPIAFYGVAVFSVYYPLQYLISRLTKYLQTKAIKYCDVRVRLMNEILDCIKLIKMYAWEERFSRELKSSRKKEQKFVFKSSYWRSLNRSMAPVIPFISAIVTFIAYVFTGNNLTPAQVFPYLSLLDVRFAFSIMLLQLTIENIISARISLDRIKDVLVMDSADYSILKPIIKTQSLAISHGVFAYDSFGNPNNETSRKIENKRKSELSSSEDENEKAKLNNLTDDSKHFQVLFDISFEATRGSLIGICGHVGSGKTSLLLAGLGQLRVLEGQVMRDGSVAYVSQQAWIINATLRENILFGAPYDDERYRRAIQVSSLIQDIDMMPAGDQTEIGEKGVNLSGGQKQRVALARALYADRDIYFLDDPLSAVDSRVGSDIFDNFILGALSGKTVLFVTHQIQYLARCDEIYMLNAGRIVERGTHDELMKLGNEYAMMVSAISVDSTTEKTTSADNSSEVLPTLGEDISSPKDVERAIADASPDMSSKNVNKPDTPGAMLTVPEQLQYGAIKAHTYHAYMTAAGGYFMSFLVIILFAIVVASNVFSSWWLAIWMKAGGGNTTVVRNNVTVNSENMNDHPDFWYYQTIYAGSLVAILVLNYFRTLVFIKTTTNASTNLHNNLFQKIINSPMRFFDTTPTGRIQHIFSRDMDEVDYQLPSSLLGAIHYAFVSFFAMLAVCFVFPWLLLPLGFLAVGYCFVSNTYRKGLRSLRRLENKSRGPMISIVTATMQGLSTIRAFGKETDFITKFTDIFDGNSKCLFHFQGAVRWLVVRINMMAIVIVSVTSLLVIILRDQVSPALAGLALSYAANISGILQYGTRQILEGEIRFISVEKINHYIRTLTGEGKTEQPIVKLPIGWPVVAEIKFKNVSMAYGDGTPLILRNVSFSVNAGEKIGIVGRTGSGKSSLTVALFRLVELAGGKIEIDDVDISEISLKQLRTKLSIIPQDPTLFSGTLRSNLDPFGFHSDAKIWEALEKTKLKSRVQSISGHLDAPVGFGGDNLSVGERQLLCLTRALLRDTKILILDEATAAVDPETEIAVQTMIQQEFSHCTILTIAHRLQTVLPLNRILVMNDGEVLEFDTPSNLLSNQKSEFSKMLAAAEQINM